MSLINQCCIINCIQEFYHWMLHDFIAYKWVLPLDFAWLIVHVWVLSLDFAWLIIHTWVLSLEFAWLIIHKWVLSLEFAWLIIHIWVLSLEFAWPVKHTPNAKSRHNHISYNSSESNYVWHIDSLGPGETRETTWNLLSWLLDWVLTWSGNCSSSALWHHLLNTLAFLSIGRASLKLG